MNELLIESAELAPLVRDLLHRDCAVRFTARGSSMRPFILDGDILTVIASDGSGIRVGDVAFHEHAAGSAVAHRVLRKSMRDGKVFLETRGDAFAGPPEVISAEGVMGKVVSVQRGRRVLCLDRWPRRALARLWTALSPVGQVLLHISRRPR